MSETNGTAVALGTFDGIHKGHISVLETALKFTSLRPVAVTFDEPPKRHTSGFVPMLMTSERKNKLLSEMGFSEVYVLDYEKIHDLSPEAFLDKLFAKFNVKAAVCGFNYRFGKDGTGDTALLSDYCRSHGAEAVICPETAVGGQVISSSYLRELVANGDLSYANKLLYKPFSFEAEVIHGDERGKTIGFPTINQLPDKNLAVPRYGVYASRVYIDGKAYHGVTNIGIRPTFLLEKPLFETHIIGFSGDLYGKKVLTELLFYIRPETRFEDLAALKKAIEEDIKRSEK